MEQKGYEIDKRKIFKPLVAKAYFDRGWGLTSYLKYMIALFGISSLDVKKTLILGIFYGIGCYLLGRAWYKYRIQDIETEINNRFNPFVGELREKFGIPNKRKI
ncbi:MAG: hypothetical protein ACTSR1_01055 [Candidatus Heimdallarchaeota archaeon]